MGVSHPLYPPVKSVYDSNSNTQKLMLNLDDEASALEYT